MSCALRSLRAHTGKICCMRWTDSELSGTAFDLRFRFRATSTGQGPPRTTVPPYTLRREDAPGCYARRVEVTIKVSNNLAGQSDNLLLWVATANATILWVKRLHAPPMNAGEILVEMFRSLRRIGTRLKACLASKQPRQVGAHAQAMDGRGSKLFRQRNSVIQRFHRRGREIQWYRILSILKFWLQIGTCGKSLVLCQLSLSVLKSNRLRHDPAVGLAAFRAQLAQQNIWPPFSTP